MNATPELTVVVPAFNEEARLGPTLDGALSWFRAEGMSFELIVVDDGSLDGTSHLVRGLASANPELRLLRLAANHGKGHAVRSGVLNALGRLVLFADADGATPWGEYRRLARALSAGADVAIGSRAHMTTDTHVRARLHRRVMGRIFAWLVRVLALPGVDDTQCGFKLFRGDVAQELFSRMRMDGFSFDVEVLLMARHRGYRIAEVPVNWAHQQGSRVSLLLDSLRMARDLFIIRGHAIRGDYDQPRVAEVHAGSEESAVEALPGES